MDLLKDSDLLKPGREIVTQEMYDHLLTEFPKETVEKNFVV